MIILLAADDVRMRMADSGNNTNNLPDNANVKANDAESVRLPIPENPDLLKQYDQIMDSQNADGEAQG